MAGQTRNVGEAKPDGLPPLPITAHQWRLVAAELRLSPQQARIVELILRGLSDRQIAAHLGLRVPTIRTYLARIFARLNVGGRTAIVLRVLATLNGAAHHGERRRT